MSSGESANLHSLSENNSLNMFISHVMDSCLLVVYVQYSSFCQGLFGLVIGILLDMRCYFAQFPLYIKSWYVIVFVLDAIHLLYYYYLLLWIIVMVN